MPEHKISVLYGYAVLRPCNYFSIGSETQSKPRYTNTHRTSSYQSYASKN